jgi:RND family efflux transporter MFP subunit
VTQSPQLPTSDADPEGVPPQADASGRAADLSGGPEVPEKTAASGAEPPKSDTTWRTTRRMIVFAAVLAVALGVVYKVGQRPRIEARIGLEKVAQQTEKAPPVVNVVKPVVAPVKGELKLPGQTRAFYQTTLFARVNGYLRVWLVDIGDRVEQDQLLALIETPELDEQLMEAKAKVEALKADIKLAQAQLDFAKISSERWNAAAPEGAVSLYERDEKNAEYGIALARLDASKAQLQLGEAAVRRLESELSFKQVIAPFKGVITERHIDVGSLITLGSNAATTPLFTIAQSDTIRVFVKVPQTAVPDIYVGMSASVTAQEYPGRVFTGTVDRTATSIDPVSRTLNVEVLVPNSDLTLMTGMYVTVNFEISRRHPPFLIEAAVLNIWPEGLVVAEVDTNDRVHFRKVKVARDLGNVVEVAEGLRGDEWLAVNISNEISEGERVQPIRLGSPLTTAPSPSSATPVVKNRPGAAKGVLAEE